ncbi:hypothetical protein GYA93_14520 [Gordonia desulfuricans]|uniref:Type II toxin-antitoxin system HicA family toxin n=1 Tax=Gordonia desulfuricans TaxID=89051 RepID=A0A7K3LTB5_9ACTN|nr:hypothetical protein [Gordonia desulfuricans]NDK90787.1 hypothetical protein [Gordonia desulfuricans]
MDKDTKRLLKDLQQQGFEIRTTAKSHIMVYRDGRRVTTLSGTPSDRRASLNAMAALKRAGYVPRQ